MLVSERIGQLFVETHAGRDRLEFTEYGGGDAWVVLLPAELLPRRMQQPLARVLAAQGFHVVTLDPLGHGRSDRPADPQAYSVTVFAEQVVALLDHLGASQAVVGGTSLGANTALETAAIAPDRVRGLILEAPILDNGVEAGILTFGPVLLTARFLPLAVSALRRVTRSVPRGIVPFWAGIALDTCNQRPGAVAALLHGMFFGRVAPSARERRRIDVPALVVGHPFDLLRPLADAEMLAGELPRATLLRARTALEWRLRPQRLDEAAVQLVAQCWRTPRRRRRAGS
ncbi:alpha/beta fold hydrolase [Nocardioides sp. URHA0020]|uniref:alpha/beta fold hydrolase n=1 Tax=Nocardioides sp. URHA0020 TaxID=1380392 RepID=UPI00048E5B37|nr:alpha/beta hydrolase [Nocardioides sp. URHA0020]